MEDSDGYVSGSASDDDEFDYQPESDMEVASDAELAIDHNDQMIIEPPQIRKAPFITMNREELRERQKRCINDSTELLDVPAEEAFLLLRFYKWDLARLQEDWFADSDRVREKVGIGPPSDAATSSSVTPLFASPAGLKTCPICYSECDKLLSLECGHGFCQDCWRNYLHIAVDEGKASVQTRCPQHKCGRIVTRSFFHELCDEERQQKYQEWFLLSYVDDNPVVKWCTNPAGCKNAVECHNAETIEIRCACDFVWCWACGEEAHKPASCKTVDKWNVKNSAESENISWIRAHTKNCPKCTKPIEKNQGCNHMTCSVAGGCGHEFCWLCLGDWSTHGSATGGNYQCNIYEKQAKEGKYSEEETTRQKAKHDLSRYIHFFERFMDHERGMKLTVSEEADTEKKVKDLHDNHGFEIVELQFLYDALRQVRNCRRILKWSYVYGYYLEEEGPEKNLFEHLQTHLEEKTDALHEMLEKDLQAIFFDGEDLDDLPRPRGSAGKVTIPKVSTEENRRKFREFRSHVTNYTNVTQKFLTQFMTDLCGAGKLTASAGLNAGGRA